MLKFNSLLNKLTTLDKVLAGQLALLLFLLIFSVVYGFRSAQIIVANGSALNEANKELHRLLVIFESMPDPAAALQRMETAEANSMAELSEIGLEIEAVRDAITNQTYRLLFPDYRTIEDEVAMDLGTNPWSVRVEDNEELYWDSYNLLLPFDRLLRNRIQNVWGTFGPMVMYSPFSDDRREVFIEALVEVEHVQQMLRLPAKASAMGPVDSARYRMTENEPDRVLQIMEPFLTERELEYFRPFQQNLYNWYVLEYENLVNTVLN